MRANFRQGHFSTDGLDGDYDGYTDGALWNGWACPVFERNVADRIAADLATLAVHHAELGHASVFYEPEVDSYRVEEEGNDPVWFGSETISVDGCEVEVYMLGTGYWTWEERQESAATGS